MYESELFCQPLGERDSLPYARASDLTVTLSRIAVQYLTLIFHQHTEAKDVITSKGHSSDKIIYWMICKIIQ
jgi:hypothetical protein